MISIKKIVGALIVLFVIIVNLNKSYGIYEKEILFISSYSPEFISFKDQVEGIKDTLGDEFNLQVQYMNAKSFSDKVDESDFYNLLKYSIAIYKNLEGILIGDDDALEFYLKYKEDLFKDIPASFFGIYDKKNIERALKYKNVAGVREVESLDKVSAQDTTGAGDSFIGSLLYQVAEGEYSLEQLVDLSEEKVQEILTFSNATAALTVCKKGAIGALPLKEEVLAKISER